jgi:hypothetical protein
MDSAVSCIGEGTCGSRTLAHRARRVRDSPQQERVDSVARTVGVEQSGSHAFAHRARCGRDSQGQGGVNTVARSVGPQKSGCCTLACRARRGRDSPGQAWVDPLHRASAPFGRGVDITRASMDSIDPTVQDEDGLTQMHRASVSGIVGLPRFLVEHGADVKARDKDGSTPLHPRIGVGKRGSRMLPCGARRRRNSTGQERSTPLHNASASGNVDLARFLVERGADATAKDKDSSTPLHRVSALDLACFLVEHGADPMAKDKDGANPLHTVLRRRNVNLHAYIIRHYWEW